MPTESLKLADIIVDYAHQPRESLDEATVERYCELYKERPEELPPPVVFRDIHSGDIHLSSGFHRLEAMRRNGVKQANFEVRDGNLEDSCWFSSHANKANGLQMKAGDFGRAVKLALKCQQANGMTDGELAAHVGCSRQLVQKVRSSLKGRKEPPAKAPDPEPAEEEVEALAAQPRVIPSATGGTGPKKGKPPKGAPDDPEDEGPGEMTDAERKEYVLGVALPDLRRQIEAFDAAGHGKRGFKTQSCITALGTISAAVERIKLS